MANRFYVINCKNDRRTLYSTGWAVLQRGRDTDRFVQWYGVYGEARTGAQQLNEEGRTPYGYARIAGRRGAQDIDLPHRFRFKGAGIVDAAASVARRLGLVEVCRHDAGRNAENEPFYEVTYGRNLKSGGYTPKVSLSLIIERV